MIRDITDRERRLLVEIIAQCMHDAHQDLVTILTREVFERVSAEHRLEIERLRRELDAVKTGASQVPDLDCYTPTQVAKKLGRSRTWIYEQMDSGALPYRDLDGDRGRLIRREDLDAFRLPGATRPTRKRRVRQV